MDWLFYSIRDFLVFAFENGLEPLGNLPNLIYLFIFFGGAIYWMLLQHKLNKKADQDPNQVK
jgi:hypothetical protein